MGTIAGAAAAAAKSSGSSSYTFLLLIVLVFVGFYFLMIRPQRRRQQQAQQQQRTVGVGARVRTTAGMYATVSAVDGDDVILELAPGVDVRFMRRAVMEVVSPGDETEEEPIDDEAEGYDTDDLHDAEADPSDEHEDTTSAEDGLAASHDGELAKSDQD
jgi:preprotein translocase subunit YajC